MLVPFIFNNVFDKILKLGERKREIQKLQNFLIKKWAQVATS
jgi:hypothetical protein